MVGIALDRLLESHKWTMELQFHDVSMCKVMVIDRPFPYICLLPMVFEAALVLKKKKEREREKQAQHGSDIDWWGRRRRRGA